MRGCAELSWHAGANYILGLDERAHIQKAKQGEGLCSAQKATGLELSCCHEWPFVCRGEASPVHGPT